MLNMKFVFPLLFFVIFSLFSTSSFGAEVTVFSDQKFTRTTGAPNFYTNDFTAEPGVAILTIRNGEPGGQSNTAHRITSGVITLNGEILFTHDDFKHQTYILEIPVSLQENNSLSIELESKPDCYISLEIVQTQTEPVYDLMASDLVIDTGNCPANVDLYLRLVNNGEDTVPAGVQVAFYNGNPEAGGTWIGTTTTTTDVSTTKYIDLTFRWLNPYVEEAVIYAVVDDDGTGKGVYEEADKVNNLVSTEAVLCPIIPGDNNLSGHIINAVNGDLLAGARILLHINNDGFPGAIVASTESDSEGVFLFTDLAADSYIISAAHSGYIDNHRPVSLNVDTATTNQDIALSPVLEGNEIRIILTWNGSPADLEAHLTAPSEIGCRYHCYYFNKSIPTGNLDLDDRDGYGPETITITDRVSGMYRYYVHDFTNRYTNSRGLSLSGATVKVFYGDREPMIFSVPSGYGNVWHVFDMDGETGEITPVHSLSRQSEPGKIDYPVILSGTPSRYAYWGSAYTYQVIAKDPDNDKLTYSLENEPAGMTIDPDTGLLEWTPSGIQMGWYYNIKIKVEDDRCGETSMTFKIYVNSSPTINFSVSPCSGINPGGEITLTWSTTRATTVFIDQEIGEVAASGTLIIDSPEVPILYTLTAINDAALLKRVVPTPPGASFYFSPRYIDIGDSTTLRWNSSCSTSRSISHDIGAVDASGYEMVTPTQSGYYYLTAANAGGTRTYRTYISVRYPPEYFDVSPRCNMTPGDPMTLAWNINNATNVSISPDIGPVEAAGSRVVHPVEPGTYTLSATVDDHVTTRSVSFPDLPTIDTSPRSSAGINLGQSVNIRYWSQCADTVSFNQGIGDVAANGTITATPESLPQYYTVTATNERGSRSRSVNVYQVVPQASASPYRHYMDLGDYVTLSWSTSYADSVAFDQGIGPVQLNGKLAVAPDSLPKIYTLTATNSAGSTVRRVYLYPIAPRGTLAADPTIMKVGDSTRLTWTSSRASSCTITPDIGQVALNGSMTVTPTRPTQYRLTVQGPSGSHHSYVNVGFVAPISDLKASSTTINQGETAKLTWVYANATTSFIDHGIGEVELGGERIVAPNTTTTYTMTANGPGGTAKDSVTINVIPSDQPPVINLSSSPGNILPGQSSVLNWESSNVETLTIEPDIGIVAHTGSMSVSPERTTTYTAAATGPGGTIMARAVVNVIHPSPSLNLWFEPATIAAGESAVLNWSSGGVDTITIDQGIGEVSPQGSLTLTPEATTLYTVTASGPGGNITKNISLTVIQQSPTATITASPSSINLGEATTLSWQTEYAETAVIRPGIGTVDSDGSVIVSPVEDTTYYITATSAGGLITKQVAVKVIYPEPTASITARPEKVIAGESSILSWSTEYARTCSIEPDIGLVDCSGELSVTPAEDTIYTLTATGFGGNVTTEATVGVNPIAMNITSPAIGSVLSRPDVIVTGIVSHANGLETGVVVNGMVALVHGNQFIANHIPLQLGENTITVRAIDTNGEEVEKSIAFTVNPPVGHISLSTDSESGLAPMQTTLRLEVNFSFTDEPTITYTGPGEVSFVPAEEAYTWSMGISVPGIYIFSSEVVDEAGETFNDKVAVLVLDRIVLDTLLKQKWDGMKASLVGGNIEGGLQFFLERSREMYGQTFSILGSRLPSLVNDMGQIGMIYFKDGIAKYRISRNHEIDGTPVTITYYIYFTRDWDGLYKIYKF